MVSLFPKLLGRHSPSELTDCSPCRRTFADLESVSQAERADVVDLRHPSCRCQNFSLSKHSSGPVQADEILIRVLVAPQHMNKRGRPRAAALSDAERGGLSVFREHQATNDEIRRVAKNLVDKARASQGDKADKAGVFGVLRIPCSVIRACQADDSDSPAYCVYDTALPDIPSHAEAFQRVHEVDDGLRDARRNKLFADIQSEFVAVHDFRNGLLVDLAPKA